MSLFITIPASLVFASLFSARYIFEHLNPSSYSEKGPKSVPLLLRPKIRLNQTFLKFGDDVVPLNPVSPNPPISHLILSPTPTGIDITVSKTPTKTSLPNSSWNVISPHRILAVPYGCSFAFVRSLFEPLRSKFSRERAEDARLCCCVLAAMPDGRLVVTQRIRKERRKKGGTFSGMWVFPGGHVDLVETGKIETLEDCVRREFEEETGVRLKVTGGDLKKLCSYNASIMRVKNGRSYFIVFFAGVVDPRDVKMLAGGGKVDLVKTFKNLQKNEVGKIALVAEKDFFYTIPQAIGGGTVEELIVRAEKAGSEMECVSVNDNTDELEIEKIGLKDLIGTGGEWNGNSGLGMGHRFAASVLVKGEELWREGGVENS